MIFTYRHLMSGTAFHRTNIKLHFSYCKLNGFKSFRLNSKKTILPFRIVSKKYSLKYWINYTRELGKSFDDSTKLQGIFVQLIEFTLLIHEIRLLFPSFTMFRRIFIFFNLLLSGILLLFITHRRDFIKFLFVPEITSKFKLCVLSFVWRKNHTIFR